MSVHPLVAKIEAAQLRTGDGVPPSFRAGDTVRVNYRILEGDKPRTQAYEGVVIAICGAQNRETFTVRKISGGVGVERIFPLHSPRIEKVEVAARGHVRRSRLYYLRDLRGKKARLRERQRHSD